jgi:hypothetical protein
VIVAVDHVVFAVAALERAAMAERLLRSGFKDIPLHLEFPEIAAASDSYAMAGGGFVELVYETEPARAPKAWFAELPRVIGLGFSSDDFDADLGAWEGRQGVWVMNEDKNLSDGSLLNIHAAGP